MVGGGGGGAYLPFGTFDHVGASFFKGLLELFRKCLGTFFD